MSDNKTFFLKWKGVESGPFSMPEIQSMLDIGKIGLFHSIRTKSTQWILLKDFNADEALNVLETSRANEKNELLSYLSYLVCGVSFLSPYLYLIVLAMSVILWKINEKSAAKICFILGTTISLLGFVFFHLVYPVLEQR